MDKIGFVKSVDENSAVIEIVRKGACGDKCSSCKGGCETSSMEVRVRNELNVSVGQLIKLHSDTKKLIKIVMLVYVMPLVAMILGMLFGLNGAEYFGYNGTKELIAAGASVLSLGLSYLVLGFADKKIQKSKEMELRISEIIR